MKIALICFGNEESYGLLFVGSELLQYNQEIRYFDAESQTVEKEVIRWQPDFIFFSPMTTFFPKALKISREIKMVFPDVVSVFGGHHANSSPEISEIDGVDVVVLGPAKGAIQKILEGKKGIIKNSPTTPADLSIPDRKNYYKDIPRMATRYRKVMLSMLGCPWNCSYCSSASGHLRDIHGAQAHSKYYLTRRPIPAIIEEAKDVLRLGKTHEIEWVDDDIFYGGEVETWIPEFAAIWHKEINLPMYISTTSMNALRVSDNVLSTLRNLVNCIGMGIQAIRPESLRLFNRSWDNEAKMKKAYERLASFGYRVNLQCIVGLPVHDPVEDALDTIKAMQRIGSGSIVSVYPLMVYPHTAMEKYCKEKGFDLNDACTGDTNTGIPHILFSSKIIKRIRNLCKLGTFFVKYNIDEKWMRALIDVDFDDETSKVLSTIRYSECIVDRLKSKGQAILDEIMHTTKLRY